MKNIMYIDSKYIFLYGKDREIVEQYDYDDVDIEESIKYIFKKLKDNRYLNKDTYILNSDNLDPEIIKYLYNINKLDIFSMNLYEKDIDKIICDHAIYKYDKITGSYEKTTFDLNLYSLDEEQFNSYLRNQVINNKGKTLILLKKSNLDDLESVLYLKDIYEIASSTHKKTLDTSLIINIVLDMLILALILALILRFFLWESILIKSW